MTQGEIADYVKVYNEKERREHQHDSMIAYKQAQLTAYWIWERKERKLYEEFPYWNGEEVEEIRVKELKDRMYKIANSTVIEK